MGARAALKVLAQQSHFDWRFTINNHFVTRRIDGDFLQGILIENTGYIKTLYVWAIASPWHHASRNILMNFGFRLAGGRYFEGEPSEIASKIDDQIEQEESAGRLLFEPITLEGLIALDPRILTYPENFYSNSILNLSILHTLKGETERARVMLTGLLERDNQYPLRGRSIEVTHAVIDCIDTGRSVREVLNPIAAENRQQYRIVPIKRPAGKKAAR